MAFPTAGPESCTSSRRLRRRCSRRPTTTSARRREGGCPGQNERHARVCPGYPRLAYLSCSRARRGWPQQVRPCRRSEALMPSPVLENDLAAAIRSIPDYPKPGIIFRDITTLLGNARAFRRAVDELVQPWAGAKIDKVAGIEARGFIIGGAVAHQVSAGFVPIRKKGK